MSLGELEQPFTSTPPGTVTLDGATFTGSSPGAVSLGSTFTGTAPGAVAIDPAPVMPEGYGAADYFNGGQLYQYGPDGLLAQYNILDTSAVDGNGHITLTLAGDLDPWADEGQSWVAETSDGVRYACEDIDAGTAGSPYTYLFGAFQPMPGSATLGGGAFSNSAPGAAIVEGGGAFSNTAPGTVTQGASMTDDEPASVSLSSAFTNTPPSAVVMEGEASPVEGEALPEPPLQVDHEYPLDNEANYFVSVGSRAAPVTVTLPNPAACNQHIMVSDSVGLATHYPITVDPNGLAIDGSTTPRALNVNYSVIHLVLTNGAWKIV